MSDRPLSSDLPFVPNPPRSFEASFPTLGVPGRWAYLGDWLLVWFIRCCAALAGVVTLLIFAYLSAQSFPLFTQIGFFPFFADQTWAPARGQFSLVPMLVGTLFATLGAMSLAAPLGIATAVFITFYAPWPVARLVRGVLGLLTGIPSVVYGLWGLVVLVPWLNQIHPPGFSLLLGTVILTIMVLPTVALLAQAALRAVPSEYLLGAYALGLARWQVVRSVVLPAARSGLFTSVILGTARVVGETMAVSMVMGNTIQVPESLLDPARTLTAHIALEMAYALGDHRAALFVSGWFLLVAVIGLVVVAGRVSRRREL